MERRLLAASVVWLIGIVRALIMVNSASKQTFNSAIDVITVVCSIFTLALPAGSKQITHSHLKMPLSFLHLLFTLLIDSSFEVLSNNTH